MSSKIFSTLKIAKNPGRVEKKFLVFNIILTTYQLIISKLKFCLIIFNANIRVDNSFEYLNIRKFSNAFEFSNHNGNLRLARWGENYDLTGMLKDKDGKYKYIDLVVYKRFSDEFSFAINSNGINMYFDRYSISGNFNETYYSKNMIAYIVTMVLSISVNDLDFQKD